jgi:hypothetical protein
MKRNEYSTSSESGMDKIARRIGNLDKQIDGTAEASPAKKAAARRAVNKQLKDKGESDAPAKVGGLRDLDEKLIPRPTVPKEIPGMNFYDSLAALNELIAMRWPKLEDKLLCHLALADAGDDLAPGVMEGLIGEIIQARLDELSYLTAAERLWIGEGLPEPAGKALVSMKRANLKRRPPTIKKLLKALPEPTFQGAA